MAADPSEIAEPIAVGGLANVKSTRIKQILEVIARRRGSLDLGFLAGIPVDEAREWLEALPGVGPKTAACVLLFACRKPAMPVDTHVHRVSRRLGLVDDKATPEQTQTALEDMVPPDQFLSFHVNMIEHGRRVCKAQKPDCANCPLRHLCDYYGKPGDPK